MEDFRANCPLRWREIADEVRRSSELARDAEARLRLLAKAQLFERLAHLAETFPPLFYQQAD